jgi:hypothetical protein
MRVAGLSIVAVLSGVFGGCSGEEIDLTTPEGEAEPVDLRRELPPPPEGGLQFVTPDYVIPPYTEVQWCWFTEYNGPDTAMSAQWTYQSPGGHHAQILSTNAGPDLYPTGEAFDCTSTDSMPMTDLNPLLVLAELTAEDPEGPVGQLILPDGLAAELESNTRIVIQSHYVNTTADPILVRDGVNVSLVPLEEVETWAAPWVHLDTDFLLPQGEHTLEFECVWEDDMNILFLGGHMHEWGTAFSLQANPAEGPSSELYAVPEWDPVMRDAPPMNRYEEAPLQVRAGDSFTTHCEWNNDTDHEMGFPEEMCVTFGMAYPLKVPIICDPD